MELAAGGVEGALLDFPAVVNARTTVLVDRIANELFDGGLSQGGLFVHIANDLSAQQPHIVDVALNGFSRQARRREVEEKRQKVFDQPPAWWKVFFLAHPTLRPLPKIAAIAAVGQ